MNVGSLIKPQYLVETLAKKGRLVGVTVLVNWKLWEHDPKSIDEMMEGVRSKAGDCSVSQVDVQDVSRSDRKWVDVFVRGDKFVDVDPGKATSMADLKSQMGEPNWRSFS